MSSESVLLTGGDGFIGRALKSADNGLNIVSFDVNEGDVTTFDFRVFNVSHVIHLAALTSVEDSWENPRDYYRVNMMGTLNVLEFCRNRNASMTYISTYVYGAPKYLPVDERHPISPASVYNHSKYLAEDMCRFYAENLGVSVTVLRLFNPYGPGQSKNFLIPNIIHQVLKSDQIELKDLKPKRDFIYIDDIVSAIWLTVGQKGFHYFNVGSGVSVSVAELCDIVQSIAGTNLPVISKNMVRKNEVMDVIADYTKIKDELGWIPKTDIRSGIKKVIESSLSERQE